jgi:hypothetical protein
MKLIAATIVALVIGAAVAAITATAYTIWAFADAITDSDN